MAFELKGTVPWGRNLEEYKKMFNLTDSEINKRIISFGDGPASFNCEMTQKNKSVISIDPIYQFSADALLLAFFRKFKAFFAGWSFCN